jgi:rhomboid protease GluP
VHQDTFLDRLVETVTGLLDRIGLNGTRLRWKWRVYRSARAEEAAQREIRFRAVKAEHKMCPHCRSLIPSGQVTCGECGESVAHVRGGGPGRLLEWFLPGASPATATLISANIAVYAVMGLVAGFAVPESPGLGSLFSLFGFDRLTLFRFGMGARPLIVYEGEIWRLVTPLFIHAGLLHLLFNCFVLLQVGKLVEEEYGSTKMWVVYLTAGLCGGFFSNFVRYALFGVNVPYVGASGAVFGLIGLALVYGWRRGGALGDHLKRTMLTWTLYVFLIGFVLPADNFAHFGGLAGGAVMGLLVEPGPSRSPIAVIGWRAAGWLGVVVCMWAFSMAAIHGGDILQKL